MEDTTFVMLLGLWMLYSTGHFLVLQFYSTWKNRSKYEKVVTVSAVISILLIFISTISG